MDEAERSEWSVMRQENPTNEHITKKIRQTGAREKTVKPKNTRISDTGLKKIRTRGDMAKDRKDDE